MENETGDKERKGKKSELFESKDETPSRHEEGAVAAATTKSAPEEPSSAVLAAPAPFRCEVMRRL